MKSGAPALSSYAIGLLAQWVAPWAAKLHRGPRPQRVATATAGRHAAAARHLADRDCGHILGTPTASVFWEMRMDSAYISLESALLSSASNN